MRWRSRATGRAARAAPSARIRVPDYVRSSGRDRGRLGTAGFPGARASRTLGGLPHRGPEARAPRKSCSTGGGGPVEARPAQRSGGRRSGRRSRGRSRPVHAREAPGRAGGAPQRAASPPRGRGRWRIAPCSRSSRGNRRRRRAAPPLAGDEHRPLPVRGQEPALGVDLLAVEAGPDVEPELFGPTKTPGLPSSISASSNRLKLRRQRFVSIRRGSRLRTVRSESVRPIPGHGAIGARHLERHLSRFVHTVTLPRYRETTCGFGVHRFPQVTGRRSPGW